MLKRSYKVLPLREKVNVLDLRHFNPFTSAQEEEGRIHYNKMQDFERGDNIYITLCILL